MFKSFPLIIRFDFRDKYNTFLFQKYIFFKKKKTIVIQHFNNNFPNSYFNNDDILEA
ncbi:MAG: hypothetical protein BWY27_00053 [Bacteroidetes bacterium ADurb.Bin234]|nr:MAG: hypothetical protein BWY27_00053 [Bacteroidetes bacterium ADurb.Bin234]